MMPRPDGRIGLDVVLLALFSLVSQIFYLAVLPVSFEGDAAGYYLYARFLAGDPDGLFIFQRPPGYPLFLMATGLTWLKSFDLAIALQAVMGAAAPLLVYGTLRTVSRPAALAAAAVFALSGVPHSYAKLFTTEQVFMFSVLTALFGVSRFIDTKRPAHAILALGAAVAALMVRQEAVYLAALVFVVLLASAWPIRRSLAAVALSGALALAGVVGWSAERAVIMDDPALVGSLSNFVGHQLFWRVYVMLGGPVRFWQCVVARPRPASCADGSTATALLVLPENGPATRRLAALVSDWAAVNGHDPQRILADFFAKPSDSPPVDWNGLAAKVAVEDLGYLKGDELLRRVAVEAIKAHPEIVYMMAASVGAYFGLSFHNVWYHFRFPSNAGPVIFANWQEDAMEAMPFNIGDLARQTMHAKLWNAYRKSHEKPIGSLGQRLLHIGRTAHNVVRNGVGLIFLASWPALLWSRHRMLSFFLLGSLGLMMGAYAVAFGYGMRFEHTVLPIMLMASAIVVDALVRSVRYLIRSRRGAR